PARADAQWPHRQRRGVQRAAGRRVGAAARRRRGARTGARAGGGARAGAARVRVDRAGRAAGRRERAGRAAQRPRAARATPERHRSGRQRGAARATALRQRPDRLPGRARHAAHAAQHAGQRGRHLRQRRHRPRSPVQGARRRLAVTPSPPATRTQRNPHRPNPAMTKSDKAPTNPPAGGLDALLGGARVRRWWRRPMPWIAVALVALVAAGAWFWLNQKQTSAAPRYVTEEARRGDLTLTVTADGKLQATRSVNIGSELSGTVRRVLVDVNDRVKKGQVLVELDTAKLKAQVERARASMAAAQAKLAQTTATVKEAQASLARLQEVSRLSGGKVPSAAELDAARAALDRARADENSA